MGQRLPFGPLKQAGPASPARRARARAPPLLAQLSFAGPGPHARSRSRTRSCPRSLPALPAQLDAAWHAATGGHGWWPLRPAALAFKAGSNTPLLHSPHSLLLASLLLQLQPRAATVLVPPRSPPAPYAFALASVTVSARP
jgi:hypothetical protein